MPFMLVPGKTQQHFVVSPNQGHPHLLPVAIMQITNANKHEIYFNSFCNIAGKPLNRRASICTTISQIKKNNLSVDRI